MIELADMIAILSAVIANGIVIAAAYTKLNIRITEVNRDMLSFRAEMQEHKIQNKEDLKETKAIAIEEKRANKEDHQIIVSEISKLSEAVYSVKLDIIGALKAREKRPNDKK